MNNLRNKRKIAHKCINVLAGFSMLGGLIAGSGAVYVKNNIIDYNKNKDLAGVQTSISMCIDEIKKEPLFLEAQSNEINNLVVEYNNKNITKKEYEAQLSYYQSEKYAYDFSYDYIKYYMNSKGLDINNANQKTTPNYETTVSFDAFDKNVYEFYQNNVKLLDELYESKNEITMEYDQKEATADSVAMGGLVTLLSSEALLGASYGVNKVCEKIEDKIDEKKYKEEELKYRKEHEPQLGE